MYGRFHEFEVPERTYSPKISRIDMQILQMAPGVCTHSSASVGEEKERAQPLEPPVQAMLINVWGSVLKKRKFERAPCGSSTMRKAFGSNAQPAET